MIKRIFWIALIFIGLIWIRGVIDAEEGIFPISEIHKLNLKAKGLEIEPTEIFNPDGLSLINAVVQVGATGSFVSPEGLIITNHHVAYGSVQAASTKEHDYIREGFLARNRSEEIPARGRTARITESYRDVSREVLGAVKPEMGPADRTRAIEQKMKEIVAAEEKENPGIQAEVAEMFRGKTYVLFTYTNLLDIRLVYVPPRSIGEFGGNVDNWMWPRHTGDFSFMRAYVAPDGSPAAFSAENVPFRPKKYLKIAPQGVDEGDFIFLLGYPGRTYRHRTSHFLAYEEEVRMPFVVEWYGRQIDIMQKMGAEDRGVALKHLSRIKGLSNTEKNYRGKLQGLKRLQLVERRRREENALQKFIEADPKRNAEYGAVLSEIANIYAGLRTRAEYELVLSSMRGSVNMLGFGIMAYEAARERPKPDLERKTAYMERNFERTKQRLRLTLRNYFEPTDKAVLKAMLLRAARLPEQERMAPLWKCLNNDTSESSIDRFITALYEKTKLDEEVFLMKALETAPEELKNLNDPFIDLAEALYPIYDRLEETQKERKGVLDGLSARLIDVKQQYQATSYIPDANRTLRLTFGRIKGYSPGDAITYAPFTSLDGVIEKSTGEAPFDTPRKIFDLHAAREYGRFVQPELNSVPVCILYDADTTGGNSGSPVLNARGELVGVNFDRTYEATINDFGWSPDYSRSIGVDIRYVLWVTRHYGGVEYLLKEMNVE